MDTETQRYLMHDLRRAGLPLGAYEAHQRLKAQKRLETVVRAGQRETISLLGGEYCAQPAHRRLGFPITPTAKAQRPLCGAKCRDGHTCKAKVVDGSRRCRLHGGLSTGPKTQGGLEAIRAANRRRAKAV